MSAPTTVSIVIASGTVVFAHVQVGKEVQERPVTLKGMCFIDNATRLPDGRYGYSLGRSVYSVAGGCARELTPTQKQTEMDADNAQWWIDNHPAR